MSRSAGNPSAFISSTMEDLRDYRQAVSDAALGAQVLPTAAEYWAARGKRPPLETCLEKVSQANVLVLLVAHRYGWVPDGQPEGERKSITWLECLRAVEEGKEVLAFVLEEDHPWPEKFTEEYLITQAIREGKSTLKLLKEVQAAVDGLKEFKKWLDKQGFRKTFTTLEDLQGKAEAALRDWRQDWEKSSAQPAKSARRAKPRPLEVPAAYKEWLLTRCSEVGLLGLRPKQVQTVRLNSVYVPLTTPREAQPDSPKGARKREIQGEKAPQLLIKLLGGRSLYVSGVPGSGKSTFCRWLTWLVCAGGVPGQEVEAPKEYRESLPGSLQDRLPLLVPLRQMWEHLPTTAGMEQLQQGLERWLGEIRPSGLDHSLLAAHIAEGKALLILDGVDEVPLSHTRGSQLWAPRRLLLDGVAEAVAAWEKSGNRILVTSRPYGLTADDQARLGLPHAPIEEFADPQQDLLARRWFHIQSAPGESAESRAQDMLNSLRSRPGLDVLCRNPLLLTATCIIYGEGKQLPQDKFDLYSRIVNTWARKRSAAPFPWRRLFCSPAIRSPTASFECSWKQGATGTKHTGPRPVDAGFRSREFKNRGYGAMPAGTRPTSRWSVLVIGKPKPWRPGPGGVFPRNGNGKPPPGAKTAAITLGAAHGKTASATQKPIWE